MTPPFPRTPPRGRRPSPRPPSPPSNRRLSGESRIEQFGGKQSRHTSPPNLDGGEISNEGRQPQGAGAAADQYHQYQPHPQLEPYPYPYQYPPPSAAPPSHYLAPSPSFPTYSPAPPPPLQQQQFAHHSGPSLPAACAQPRRPADTIMARCGHCYCYLCRSTMFRVQNLRMLDLKMPDYTTWKKAIMQILIISVMMKRRRRRGRSSRKQRQGDN